MADIQPGVERRIAAPSPGERVTVIVGLEGEPSEETLQPIRDAGGEIEEPLPYDSVVVSVQESNLEALCELSVVSTVEFEGRWEPMEGEGNFRSQPGSNRSKTRKPT